MVQFVDFKYLGEGSDLVGRDKEKEEVIYRIASGNMLMIEGEKGVGKSALLEYAIENFKGQGRVIYIDIGTFGRRLDIARLLKDRPKGMILLIDNVEYLSKSNNKKIKYFYDQDHIKSVVFVTRDLKAVDWDASIESRVGRNIIKLKALGKKEFFDIAKDKLGEDFVVSEKVLDELHKKSKSLKAFLINCDLLCKYLDEKEKSYAEVEDVAKVVREEAEDVVENCLECNAKLVEVAGHWRCKNCDGYCDACGTLTDDDECPSCGAEIKPPRDDSGEPEVKK